MTSDLVPVAADSLLTAPGRVEVSASQQPTSLLNFIAQAVSDPSVDVHKLDALLRMQREVAADEARVAFFASLHKAQQEMPRIKKNGTIDMKDKGSMKFARWEDIDDALRPIMQNFGFSLSFTSAPLDGGRLMITGRLRHTLGHYEEAALPIALDTGAGRNNNQAAGSSISYGKRYIAEMLFNIVREAADDDGNAGGVVFVTREQADELAQLMEAASAGTAFLETLCGPDVRSPDEVARANFTLVKNTLMAKIRQKGRAA